MVCGRGESVGVGGSVTLEQMRLYERLKKHNQVFWHHRISEGKTSREVRREETLKISKMKMQNDSDEAGFI